MTLENKLETLIESKDVELDADLLESVRQKVKQLEEAKKDDDKKDDKIADKKDDADEVDEDPAVKIDNPINPDLEGEVDASEDEPDGKKVEESKCEPEDAANQSVTKKETVSESISDLFGAEFSDDFKLKASTIFEAAIKDKTTQIEETLKAEYAAKAKQLEEEFKVQLVEKSTAFEETLSEEVNGYLTQISESWLSHNELAVVSGVRADLVESFINGMKVLFEEHYVDLPAEKLDMVAQLEEEKKALEVALSESTAAAAQLQESLNTAKREQIMTESAKDFTDLDFQRMCSLMEDTEYVSEDVFRKKLSIVKQAFFETKQEKTVENKESLIESFKATTPIVEEKTVQTEEAVPTQVDGYLKYLK